MLDESNGNYYGFLAAAVPTRERIIPARRLAAARELLDAETMPARKSALRLLIARILSKKGDFLLIPAEVEGIIDDASADPPARALACRFLGQAMEGSLGLVFRRSRARPNISS